VAGRRRRVLNHRNRLKILEDGKGEIHVTGLTELDVYDVESFNEILTAGSNERTTHVTEANDTSSRSHAILQIVLKDAKTEKLRGKLSLVDLAGSERGTDTKSHNQQRRVESADINTSLLTLKECIRALDTMNKKGITKPSQNGTYPQAQQHQHHVPYRGSKLTLILKDCFTSDQAMTTMIATVSPGASSTDHSINTLRYADRIKSQKNTTNTATTTSGASTKNNNKVTPPPPTFTATTASQLRNRARGIIPASAIVSTPLSNPSPSSASSPHRTTNSTPKSIAPTNTRTGDEHSGDVKTDDDMLFRQTVEAILEQEENILSTHMNNIQENAELLTVEGDLLSAIQEQIDGNNKLVDDDNPANVSAAVMDDYVSALEEILDRKEDMILNLQQQIMNFHGLLKQEKDISKRRVQSGKPLSQY
jgi:kinesin family member 2/24